jgi:hypothetical protein
MAGRDLHWLTITEASKLLQTRQVSAAEILEDTLEWVKKTDPITRNFAYLAEKEAREEARRADEEIGRGNYRGPLHGIPYTVKALISVAGAPMAWNSKVYANWSPKKDAEVVRRTRNAGGVLLGKVRVCLGRYYAADPQPMGWPLRHRRVQRRLGFVDCGRPGDGLVGHRLRMLGAESLCAQRLRRDARDAGPRASKRCGSALPNYGHGRAPGAHGARPGSDAEWSRRVRPQ